MRTLILTPDLYTRGGIARYTATLAAALGELIGSENVHVQPLLESGDPGSVSRKYYVLDAVTRRLNTASKFRFAARALRLGWRKYDLVVCTHVALAPVAALMHLLFGTSYWITCHGRESWQRFPVAVRWAMSYADLILPISRFTAETVAQVNEIPRSKMRVIYNAIPDDFVQMLTDRRDIIGSAAPVNRKEKIILSVGMVSTKHPYKGFDTVIKALPKVLQSAPDTRYMIVGEGDDIDRMKRLAREMGVQNHVEFKGGVSDADLAACYRACDVFVLPSRVKMNDHWEGEGFGRVFVEAALAGKPVVGSHDGGAAEAVLHTKTGLLVDPSSIADVAGAIIALLQNPQLAATMGDAGKRWTASNFTMMALKLNLVGLLSPYGITAQYIQNSPHGSECKFGDQPRPLVSVCVPTYKRLALLKRAVESVYAQTYDNWEIVVSDDEDPAGETWEYLQYLEKSDPRVRVFRNKGRHGQVTNTNNAFIHARGEWIKPLHDDDVLTPDSLEKLQTAGDDPSVAMVSGLSCEVQNSHPIPSLRRRGAAPIELIPQRYVHLGMFLQDCSIGIPSRVIVRREAVTKGAMFEEAHGIHFGVDTWWNCLVAEHGDVVLLNDVVVEHHQKGHSTLTSEIENGDLEAEYPIVLGRIRRSIHPCLRPPTLAVVLQMVMGIRALHYLHKRQIREAFNLIIKVRHPHAFWLIARWMIRQRFPEILSVVPRIRCGMPAFSDEAARR